MACEACEHCQLPLSRHEAVMREGYSYHKQCHKCYVCSETNLQNAEVFKGVIFCSSCSQRIFQGCSTARRTKTTRKRTRSRNKRQTKAPTTVRSRSRLQRESGVIELARLGRSTDSDSYSDNYCPKKITSKKVMTSAELALQVGNAAYEVLSRDLKKESTEIGMTTEFTQQLLKEMNCPIVEWKVAMPCTAVLSREQNITAPAKPQKKYGDERKHKAVEEKKKPIWSDLRIAELGASTEIAHMALRKQSKVDNTPSGMPMETPIRINDSQSLSVVSDVSDDALEDWIEQTTKPSKTLRFMDRPIRSIVKMPYRYFKNNILDRSSLVSVLVNGREDYRYTILKKFKMLFHEEIAEHHRRGVKRLYSTINRRKTPYRMGWLRLEYDKGALNNNSRLSSPQTHTPSYKCKHFRHSHSYRCLRSHVMRLAGPTRSQLELIRSKVKRFITVTLVKKILSIYHQDLAITSAIGGVRIDPDNNN